MGQVLPDRSEAGEGSGGPVCEVLAPESLNRIVGALFPLRLEKTRTGLPEVEWDPSWDVTMDEVVRAVKRLGAGKKAPDPGLCADRYGWSPGARVDAWLHPVSARGGDSPAKMARLVLLRKKDKPEGEPSSYRPICLLDESGKFFERVIAERLRAYMDEVRGISDDQYGFRRGRSTVDAILRVRDIVMEGTRGGRVVLAVSLDIANAFNSLPWSTIREALGDKGVPPLPETRFGYLPRR